MKIHQQGWNEQVGLFHSNVILDETRIDYEIFFADGTIGHQQTPFRPLQMDWEQDGAPYSKLGAFFDIRGQREFFTPEEIAALALHGRAVIPGLQIEDLHPNLADRILAATKRAKISADIQKQSHAQTPFVIESSR